MKEYLEKRREELRKRGESGFTLMEMLIVVAIIAVLIAIAIPVFTTQLENSREATDAANLRSAYAEVTAAGLTGAADPANDVIMEPTSGGTVGSRTFKKTVGAQQAQSGWQNESLLNSKIGDIEITNTAGSGVNAKVGNGTWSVVYKESDSKVTIS